MHAPWHPGNRTARTRAMTLIELILVMALLVVLMAITMPALSNFFAGRRAREEARRLLALTRFAREEAISLATPMELWLDPKARAYGLRPRLETSDDAHPPLEYTLSDKLNFDIDAGQLGAQGEALITFQPDGTIDEDSLDVVVIRDEAQNELTLARADVGVGYEIQ